MLTPLVAPRWGGSAFFFSEDADRAAIGSDTANLLAMHPGLNAIRQALFGAMAGLLLLGGTLEMGLAWFGVRPGARWAVAFLTLAAILCATLWLFVFAQYWRAGSRPTLGDTPPFIWVPTALHVPAIALGWIGLRAASA